MSESSLNISRGLVDCLYHGLLKNLLPYSLKAPFLYPVERQTMAVSHRSSISKTQLSALTAQEPKDLKGPSQKNRVTKSMGQGLPEVFIDQHGRHQQWPSVTSKHPPPYSRRTHLPSPSTHIHKRTHICGNNGCFACGPHWFFRGRLLSASLNGLVMPPAKHPPPDSTLARTNTRLMPGHSWHSEKHVRRFPSNSCCVSKQKTENKMFFFVEIDRTKCWPRFVWEKKDVCLYCAMEETWEKHSPKPCPVWRFAN